MSYILEPKAVNPRSGVRLRYVKGVRLAVKEVRLGNPTVDMVFSGFTALRSNIYCYFYCPCSGHERRYVVYIPITRLLYL